MSNAPSTDGTPRQVVEITWEPGHESVSIAQDWADSVSPRGLIQQARTAAQSLWGLPGLDADWRSELRLSNVPLEMWGEFRRLLDEARAEQDADDGNRVVREVRTRHFTSQWRQGTLVHLDGDEDWMASTTRQAIADELLEVLTPPDTEPAAPTTARDRLLRVVRGGNHA